MTCSHACARLNLAPAVAGLGFALVLLATLVVRAEPPARDAGAASARDAAASAAREVDVGSLLSAFKGMPGLEASFSEEKHIALLAKPLTSRGRLFFAQPALLLRRVEAPEPSEVLISKDSLRVRDKSGEQQLDLRARKDIRPFVESLTWILAGDRAALEKVYTIAFQPEHAGEPWRLTLKPKLPPLSQLIAALTIRGRGMVVQQIDVLETSGDKTLTRILSADPKRRFSPEERKKLFGEAAQGREPRTGP